MKKTVLLIISVLILLFSSPWVEGAPKIQFSIVYTNDVMGEVEPCG